MSRTAAILIIVIGAFMLVVGQATGILGDGVAGTVFIILGVILYRLLYTLGGKRGKPG